MSDKKPKAEKYDNRVYVAVVGIDYSTPTGEKRAEPGDKLTDLPAKSISWLLESRAIKEVK